MLSKNLKIKIYRNIILPVVLYGCEISSLILWEEKMLRVFENMVLKTIFGPRRDEVTGEWRRLHNEEDIRYAYDDMRYGYDDLRHGYDDMRHGYDDMCYGYDYMGHGYDDMRYG